MNNTAVVSSECLRFLSLLFFCLCFYKYIYIYKVGIENCHVYNSNVAINVPFLNNRIILFFFSMSCFGSCIPSNELNKKTHCNKSLAVACLFRKMLGVKRIKYGARGF